MTNETNTPEASKPLSNAKHEKFAQGVADGMTQVDAYVEAGFNRNKGSAARGQKLTKNVLVAARIEFLKQSVSDAIVESKTYTAQAVWEELLVSIRSARENGDFKAAAELLRTACESAGLDDPLYTRRVIFGEKTHVEGGVDARPMPENTSSIAEALRRKKLGSDQPVGSDGPAA